MPSVVIETFHTQAIHKDSSSCVDVDCRTSFPGQLQEHVLVLLRRRPTEDWRSYIRIQNYRQHGKYGNCPGTLVAAELRCGGVLW